MYLPGKTAKIKVLIRTPATTRKYTILNVSTQLFLPLVTSPLAKKLEQIKALIEV